VFNVKKFREIFKLAPPPRPEATISSLTRALDETDATRTGPLLLIFMRLLAGLWTVQGLLQWSAILLPAESLFDNAPLVRGAVVIFFAVCDPVAAVGLWLAAPWGGVLWLLSALTQIAVAIALPGFFSMFWVAANFALITIYFALTFEARYTAAAFAKLRQWRG
jgi:Family of unknown function (DUF6163)